MKALDQKDEKIDHLLLRIIIQKHLYDLSILKVMTVCITAYGRAAFFLALALRIYLKKIL